jgi:hypothetical protein
MSRSVRSNICVKVLLSKYTIDHVPFLRVITIKKMDDTRTRIEVANAAMAANSTQEVHDVPDS